MKNVLIVFGSMTPEHDLSCISAATILDNIDREKYNPVVVGITKEGQWFYTESTSAEIRTATEWTKSSTNRKAMLDVNYGAKKLLVFEEDGTVSEKPIDVIFARIAGNTGEDGKLQGLFELTGIPYVGCGVMSSACSMDKAISYLFADSIGMRRPMTQNLVAKDYLADKDAVIAGVLADLGERAGFPIFVKPVSTGSSVGISKVHNADELRPALDQAFSFGDKVVLEEGIVGSEIKVALLGNDEPVIGALCELNADGDWNDFETKYVAKSSDKKIPAEFEPEVEAMIKQGALDIYRALECKGFSRIDFFLTPDKQLVFNEINSMPGFQPTSIYSLMLNEVGISYTEIISRLLELAMEK